MNGPDTRPLVLITGANGNLGRTMARELERDHRIVGLDRSAGEVGFTILEADFTSDTAIALALRKFKDRFGAQIASVIHLAAYFDFTGEENPLYQDVNVEGTRRLLRALQGFEVEQFVYASTMLVHAACQPGERIDEGQPLEPQWAYPRSKAAAEAVVREEHGSIPYVFLRLAGVYDEDSMVPTLAQQIARIYERDFQSYFYSGSTPVGQSMLHRDDMLDAFRRTVERRSALPPETEILIGEFDALGYDALQDELGYLIHGTADWPTLRVPKPLAAAGAWALRVPVQIAVLLALGARLFDSVPIDRMADAERAVREAATQIPAAVCARLETEDHLGDADRDAILDISRRALGPFQVPTTPALDIEPKPGQRTRALGKDSP